ncbi:hypothetical protein [Mesorhizobium sp.]|uniref:hypothetical protein n=1 Tax=Mesorhizobium sp. TaxID=1871066 RepID=UPI0033901C80
MPVNSRPEISPAASFSFTPGACRFSSVASEATTLPAERCCRRRSNLSGNPMSPLLLGAKATIKGPLAHNEDVCRSSDPLVVAVGRPELVQAGRVEPGATVIDIGINRIPAAQKGEGGSRLMVAVAPRVRDRNTGSRRCRSDSGSMLFDRTRTVKGSR